MTALEFAQLTAAVAAVLAATASLIQSIRNHEKIREIHVLVNSQAARLSAAEVSGARAEGVLEGSEAERTYQREHHPPPAA